MQPFSGRSVYVLIGWLLLCTLSENTVAEEARGDGEDRDHRNAVADILGADVRELKAERIVGDHKGQDDDRKKESCHQVHARALAAHHPN